MYKVKRFFHRRGWWKSLLAAILCIGVIVGAGFGIASIFKPDEVDDILTYETLPVTKFRVGGLDGNGNYMSTDQSIYTKEAFECQGLNCTLDFDNEISYQVYFYDQNNEFVHTTGRLTGAFVQESVPFFAKYARIVITPNDDNKVSLWEVTTYAKQLKVTIYREQGYKNYTENLFEISDTSSIMNSSGEVISSNTATDIVCDYINISSYKSAFIFRVQGQALGSGFKLHFYDVEKMHLGYADMSSATVTFVSSEGVYYYCFDFDILNYTPYFVRFSTNSTNPVQFFCR